MIYHCCFLLHFHFYLMHALVVKKQVQQYHHGYAESDDEQGGNIFFCQKRLHKNHVTQNRTVQQGIANFYRDKSRNMAGQKRDKATCPPREAFETC